MPVWMKLCDWLSEVQREYGRLVWWFAIYISDCHDFAKLDGLGAGAELIGCAIYIIFVVGPALYASVVADYNL